MKDINIMFSELAQYTRIMEEAAATVDSLKDEIKAYMNEHNQKINKYNKTENSCQNTWALSFCPKNMLFLSKI